MSDDDDNYEDAPHSAHPVVYSASPAPTLATTGKHATESINVGPDGHIVGLGPEPGAARLAGNDAVPSISPQAAIPNPGYAAAAVTLAIPILLAVALSLFVTYLKRRRRAGALLKQLHAQDSVTGLQAVLRNSDVHDWHNVTLRSRVHKQALAIIDRHKRRVEEAARQLDAAIDAATTQVDDGRELSVDEITSSAFDALAESMERCASEVAQLEGNVLRHLSLYNDRDDGSPQVADVRRVIGNGHKLVDRHVSAARQAAEQAATDASADLPAVYCALALLKLCDLGKASETKDGQGADFYTLLLKKRDGLLAASRAATELAEAVKRCNEALKPDSHSGISNSSDDDADALCESGTSSAAAMVRVSGVAIVTASISTSLSLAVASHSSIDSAAPWLGRMSDTDLDALRERIRAAVGGLEVAISNAEVTVLVQNQEGRSQLSFAKQLLATAKCAERSLHLRRDAARLQEAIQSYERTASSSSAAAASSHSAQENHLASSNGSSSSNGRRLLADGRGPTSRHVVADSNSDFAADFQHMEGMSAVITTTTTSSSSASNGGLSPLIEEPLDSGSSTNGSGRVGFSSSGNDPLAPIASMTQRLVHSNVSAYGQLVGGQMAAGQLAVSASFALAQYNQYCEDQRRVKDRLQHMMDEERRDARLSEALAVWSRTTQETQKQWLDEWKAAKAASLDQRRASDEAYKRAVATRLAQDELQRRKEELAAANSQERQWLGMTFSACLVIATVIALLPVLRGRLLALLPQPCASAATRSVKATSGSWISRRLGIASLPSHAWFSDQLCQWAMLGGMLRLAAIVVPAAVGYALYPAMTSGVIAVALLVSMRHEMVQLLQRAPYAAVLLLASQAALWAAVHFTSPSQPSERRLFDKHLARLSGDVTAAESTASDAAVRRRKGALHRILLWCAWLLPPQFFFSTSSPEEESDGRLHWHIVHTAGPAGVTLCAVAAGLICLPDPGAAVSEGLHFLRSAVTEVWWLLGSLAAAGQR